LTAEKKVCGLAFEFGVFALFLPFAIGEPRRRLLWPIDAHDRRFVCQAEREDSGAAIIEGFPCVSLRRVLFVAHLFQLYAEIMDAIIEPRLFDTVLTERL
jgi:hypothetical protein